MSTPGAHETPAWGSAPAQPQANTTGNRAVAVVAHLSPLIAAVVSAGFVSFLGPLILWFVYKDRDRLVRNAAASSFNFHLTVWICWIVAWILFFTVIGIPISIVLWLVPAAAQIVLSILGAIRAWDGRVYSYPFQIPLLRR